MTTPDPGSDPDGTHRELREQLGTHAFDGLPPAEAQAVDAHVEDCADCGAELTELRRLAARLSASDADDLVAEDPALDSVAAGDPSPGGFEAIRQRIRAEADPPTLRVPTPDPPTVRVPAPAPVATGSPAREPATVVPLRRRPAARLRLAAAAAVIAVAAGGLGSLLGPDASGSGSGDRVSVQALAPGVDASAGVVSHTWGMEVKLTATGFAPGQVYRASVIDAAGTPVSAGEFVGTGDTEMRCNLNSSVLAADATGFVVTDADGAPVLRSAPL